MAENNEQLPVVAPDPGAHVVEHVVDRATGAIVSRKEQLETMMGGGSASPYWSGPRSAALQAEYRALVEREQDGVPPPAVPGAAGRGITAVPAGHLPDPGAVARDFGLDGNSATLAVALAGELERAIGQGMRELEPVLDGLDDAVRGAIIGELGRPFVERVNDAERADCATFSQTSHGSLCAARWGADTPRRLAIGMARVARAEAAMSERTYVAWQHFWSRGLTAGQRAQALDVLTR